MRVGRIGFALGYIPVLVVFGYMQMNLQSVRDAPVGSPLYLMIVAAIVWVMVLSAWRCHDFNKSAWSNFWTDQTPLIGPILGLWDCLFTPGDSGRNSYGSPPKL